MVELRVCAPIAQLDRASDYGSEGWKFESFWARHDFGVDFCGAKSLKSRAFIKYLLKFSSLCARVLLVGEVAEWLKAPVC